MQTTYRLHTQEINADFIMSLKTLFKNQEVEITVKPAFELNPLSNNDWIYGTAKNPSFDFLHDEAEDIYTINDGKPVVDEK